MSYSIKLTRREADNVAWAIDPMGDYWSEREEEGCGGIPTEAEMPVLKDGVLILSAHKGIIRDFIYRLGVQLQDMADEEDTTGARADAKAGQNAVKKITEATGETEALYEWEG